MHAQEHNIPIVIPRSITKQESLLHATRPLQTSLSISSSNPLPPLPSVVTNAVSTSLPQDPRLRPGFDYSESLRLLCIGCPTSVPWTPGIKPLVRPVVIYRPRSEVPSPHKSRKTTTTEELEPQPDRLQCPAPGTTLREGKAWDVITDQPRGLSHHKTATIRREARSDGLQDTTPRRVLVRKRKATDVMIDQSRDYSHQRRPRTQATQTLDRYQANPIPLYGRGV
ncbi:hypothetical protein BGX38DRAFT_1144668 [Terfezia claveryi]|nr:hypothetical protein BGX38DRAFT_1144668 [Terfezia claveryi]